MYLLLTLCGLTSIKIPLITMYLCYHILRFCDNLVAFLKPVFTNVLSALVSFLDLMP